MSNKALTLICLLLVTAILIGALGIYLKYDVLRPAGLFQDESIFAVPFLLLADDAAKFTLQHMAEQEIESSETEPSEPLTPATQPEQTAPIKQTQPPTEPPEPVKIDESWFDDALFIGDSRVVGLRDVARLGKAHYFCEVGMTVFKLLNCYTYDYGFGNGNLDKVLQKNTYGKIFIHLGLNECCNDQDVVVAQYQAMLDVSTELHIWLLPLLKSLAEKNLTQSEILRNLIETDKQNSHQTCPGLDELVFSNRNRSRYWFWRLDYAIWEKQLLAKEDEDVFAEIGFGEKAVDKQAILEYEFRENRSIEHLHPQDETKQPDKWEWDEINRFGNLAMISSSFNSEQRNWLVDSKLENIKPQVDNKSLQSLKLYFMYLQAKKDGGWKQGENGSMQTHERNIYKLLEESMLQYEDGQQ